MRKLFFSAAVAVGLFSTVASATMSYQKWSSVTTATTRPAIITFLGGTVPDSLVNPAPTPTSEGTIPDSFQRDTETNFVIKFWGWVTVPASGDYQFHYSCDDYGMLYVSQDEEMSHAVEVAYVDGWCSPAQWNKYPTTQHSAVMSLKKGQVMAVMAFYDQQGGGANMDLGWTGPGLSQTITAPDYLGDNITNIPPTPTAAKIIGPANGAIDVPRDSILSWAPGKFAAKHDVYFGTSFDDVNNATPGNPLGVLVGPGQEATTFDPAGLLDFGQTYYWRIDEVNAPPTDSAVFKGKIWSFTAETFGYAVKPVKATASSVQAPTMGPDKTIDGSGLDPNDAHGISATQGWLSKKGVTPVWIQYEFDTTYKLYQMWVWNSNQAVEPDVGFGAKDVTIETSLDGVTWTALANVPEFAQANGDPNYTHNTTVDFGGVQAKFVKLTISSNWADGTKQAGLSEVRFFYVPVKAFGAAPASAAVDVAPGAVVAWRPGREAVKHEVYVSSDPNAVLNGTALVKTVTEHSFDLAPLGLDYGRTYYWKVNEVNDAAATKTWEGDLWSFTTIGYAVVDDFEGYDDACNRIFFAWVDGLGYSAVAECSQPAGAGNGTGSMVGNANPPFAERTVVNSGGKSMPMWFDNTKSPFYSETQREWQVPQSWTAGGVNTLVLSIRGDAPAFMELSAGTILMNGMGTDIWANADQFRFAYKSLKGNGTIVARVDSVANTNEWAKAGVMIRETLDAGSTHAFVAVTPPSATHGVSFQRRLTTAVATTDVSYNTDVPGPTLPQWVKLTRNGTTFTAQISANGTTWTDVVVSPAVTITMANDVLVGLAVCSHVAGTPAGAKFSNVSTTGSVSGQWQVAEIGATQVNGNTPETFYVAVQDNAGKTKVVSNPDPTVIAMGSWQQWTIPLSQFSSAGINLGAVKKMVIGVGDRSAPKAGSSGKLYIDDIRLTRVVAP